MSVEQTTQLIQLILNSVLMIVACTLALGRLGVRYATLEEKLQTTSRWYTGLLEGEGELRSASNGTALWDVHVFQAKKSLRRLKRRCMVAHYSLLATYYALLFAIASTFTMTLRALINADWLIVLALGLFVVGISSLLLGIGLTLIDLHSPDLSLWEEVQTLISGDKSTVQPRLGPPVRSLKPADRTIRQPATKAKPPVRFTRVG